MSEFTSVDDSSTPGRLLGYLERAAWELAAMKQYVATAASQAVPRGTVVDIGCGAGHDLVLLSDLALRAVGVDPSGVMTSAAAERLASAGLVSRLARADGSRLPFRTGAVDGCRMERVLQHAADPAAVLDEAARVLRPGGFLAVFEPDWTSLTFSGDDPDHQAIVDCLMHVRHPAIGRRLQELIEARGFQIINRVSDLSFAEALTDLPLKVDVVLDRAVEAGAISGATVEGWEARQAAREQRGEFRACWEKILIIARKR